jgi:hypothetical protein
MGAKIRYRYTKHEGDYHYFRFPKCELVRLRGIPGSDEYRAHYAELMERVGKPLAKRPKYQNFFPRNSKQSLPTNLAVARSVYLIKRGHDSNTIKIGIAKSVHRRRSQLANSSPEKLSILRILKPTNCWPVHIESAFKALMQPCRLRGEWFKCSDILATVALHVVEHGDLAGCALVRAALVNQFSSSQETLHAYARDLARRFPYFERLKPVVDERAYWDSATMARKGVANSRLGARPMTA